MKVSLTTRRLLKGDTKQNPAKDGAGGVVFDYWSILHHQNQQSISIRSEVIYVND